MSPRRMRSSRPSKRPARCSSTGRDVACSRAMKLVLLASLLSFGSLGLGPCSSDKKSEPAPSAPTAVAVGSAAAANTDGTAIPSTPPIGVAGTAPTADNQACQILHKDDAEAWIGHALDENE